MFFHKKKSGCVLQSISLIVAEPILLTLNRNESQRSAWPTTGKDIPEDLLHLYLKAYLTCGSGRTGKAYSDFATLGNAFQDSSPSQPCSLQSCSVIVVVHTEPTSVLAISKMISHKPISQYR
jgi:hypothetical protein